MQLVPVCRRLQIHALSELALRVDFNGIGPFRARIGIRCVGNPIAVKQLKSAGAAKAAAVQELVRPRRGLIDQGYPWSYEIVIDARFVNAESQIQFPSLREFLLVLKDQGERAVGVAGAQIFDGRGRYVEVRQEGS